MKRILSILTLFCVSLSIYAYFEVNGICYEITTNYYTTNIVQTVGVSYKRYGHYSGDVIIPESVNYDGETYSVTSIGSQAFQGCIDLTSVNIPNSVTSIGSSAFRECGSLTSVNIPNSVTSIGMWAFRECNSLTSMTIPNSVTSIGKEAFLRCNGLSSVTILCPEVDSWFHNIASIKEVILGDGVTSIGYNAFSGCSSLSSVNIPNSVTSIGQEAFRRCSGLSSVAIGNSVTSIGESAFYDCSSLTSVNIPNSVTSIGRYAFQGCRSLTSVTIPNSVTSMGYGAFFACSGLTSVTILCPEINNCFNNITSIKEVILGNGVTIIGESAFSGCSGLSSVNIPNSVTSIGRYAFYGCSSLTSVTIPNGVTSIEDYVFEGCKSLTSIVIPNSVTAIGASAFSGCGITSLQIPNSVTTLGEIGALKLKYLSFGDGIEDVNDNLVTYCCDSLQIVKLGKNVKKIPSNFYCSSTMRQIEFSSEMPPEISIVQENFIKTSINIIPPKDYLFNYILNEGWRRFTNIFSVENGDTLVAVPYNHSNDDIKISNCIYSFQEGNVVELNKEATIICDKGNSFVSFRGKDISNIVGNGYSFKPSLNYRNNIVTYYNLSSKDVWHVNNETAGTLIDKIGIENVEKVQSLVVSGKINGTDLLALRKMKNLNFLDLLNADVVEGGATYYKEYKTKNNVVTSYFVNEAPKVVRLPKSTILVDNSAFYECNNLQTIILGEKTEEIGALAFVRCGLINVDIPDGVTTIGRRAFMSCKLTSITIPQNVISIDDNAFEDCNSLANVTILCEKVGLWFSHLKSIKEVFLGENVKTIGSHALYFCSGLTSIEIQGNIVSIGDCAFDECKELTSIKIPSSLTRIGGDAFSGCQSLKTVQISDLEAWCNISFWNQAANPLFGSRLYLNGKEVKDLVIPNSITSILPNSFVGCRSITSVTIPQSVTNIGSSAFYNCLELTSVNIPNSVTQIDDRAFSYCSSLNTVTIGSSVTSIGGYAFEGCSSLTTVISLNPTPPVINYYSTFDETTYENATLYVPKGCKTIYWLHPEWEKFKNIVELDGTSINDITVEHSPKRKGVYTIDGVKLSADADNIENLPKGIYIINGEKVVIK